MASNALRNTINTNISSFNSQVHCEEMSFAQFTPEERSEFEEIHDEVDMEELETVEEFWDNLLPGA